MNHQKHEAVFLFLQVTGKTRGSVGNFWEVATTRGAGDGPLLDLMDVFFVQQSQFLLRVSFVCWCVGVFDSLID